MDRTTRQAVAGCWRMKWWPGFSGSSWSLGNLWLLNPGKRQTQARWQVRHRVFATASRRMAGRFYRAEANTIGKKLAARVDHAERETSHR